jgi:ankyrin repeat protein
MKKLNKLIKHSQDKRLFVKYGIQKKRSTEDSNSIIKVEKLIELVSKVVSGKIYSDDNSAIERLIGNRSFKVNEVLEEKPNDNPNSDITKIIVKNPLYNAIKNGNSELVSLFLDKGFVFSKYIVWHCIFCLNPSNNSDSNTILEMVKKFVEKNLDYDFSFHDKSILYWLVANNIPKVLDFLISKGLDLTIKHSNGLDVLEDLCLDNNKIGFDMLIRTMKENGIKDNRDFYEVSFSLDGQHEYPNFIKDPYGSNLNTDGSSTNEFDFGNDDIILSKEIFLKKEKNNIDKWDDINEWNEVDNY